MNGSVRHGLCVLIAASLCVAVCLGSCGAGDAAPDEIFPGDQWTWAESPEALGWSSEKLADARAYADRIGTAAVMIVDDGIVVTSWGDHVKSYRCHSMRKSLVSALYGVYVDEGTIDLSNTLAELGIDDVTPLTATEKQATVADLLRARSGVYLPAAGEVASMIEKRPERGSHEPGTFWYYNNWDFNALGTIFEQATGEASIYEAFRTRIAEPIGMRDYRPERLAYHYVSYSMHPNYQFDLSTRDLARFGLLFLREGRWNGRQIVSSDWVRESTAPSSQTGTDSGYGYMWWTGTAGGLFPHVTVAGDAYYAAGYRGHRVVVLPHRDLVIVHRVDTFRQTDEVTDEEFGILLWRILDAAGGTGIGDVPFVDWAPGIRLAGDDLRATISGSRLSGWDGPARLTVLNDADGGLSILVDGTATFVGTWSIEGNAYCVDVPNADHFGECFDVVLDGADLRLFGSDGTIAYRFTIDAPAP